MCGDKRQERLVRVWIQERSLLVYWARGGLWSADRACARARARAPCRRKAAGVSQAVALGDFQKALLRWACAVAALSGTVCVHVPSVKESGHVKGRVT